MPGISGSVSREAERSGRLLARLEGALYPGVGLARLRSTAAPGFAVSVASRLPGAGLAERDGAWLAFEGWLADPELPAAELPVRLLERFLSQGERFVEPLRGSFQIAIHRSGVEGGTTWLFADPVASRRLFYLADGENLAFAPEVAPLAGLPGAGGVAPANLVQFLVAGRFFAGESLLSGVRQLLPGEILVHHTDPSGPSGGSGRLERRSSFRYAVAPGGGEPDLPARIAELEAALDRAILGAFRQARHPVFLLSGGYDSRYIFRTVASATADPSLLRTALFGQRLDLPDSDNAIARAVARRFGIEHLTFPWRAELLPEQFGDMFAAQSGMTELIFTHSDELEIFRRLGEEGFGAVFRGDECFGPRGEEVASLEEGLRRVALCRPGQVADLERWFGGDPRPWAEAHAERLGRLVEDAPTTPAELRDTLYGRERLPALLGHHNYHKSHFLEMVNPLLDVDVLRLWSALPAECRTDKRLFRESYHRRFGAPPDPPIATLDNGIDWPGTLRSSPVLAGWVRERLAALPGVLDRGYFLGRLDQLLAGRPDPASPGSFRIPPMKLVARAVVLGEWWRSGLLA